MQAASFKFIAITALSFAAAAASITAQAETYDGVHPGGSMMARGTVVQGAIEVANAGNVYGDVAGGGVTQAPVMAASRADVHREAVATARIGNPYGEAASSGPVSEIFAANRGDATEAQVAARNGDSAVATVAN